jgi:hypothetical protein
MDLFTFSGLWSTRWALSVGLAFSTSVAFAQEAALPEAQKLKYKSVFSQYQGFKEQAVLPWRESNEVVQKIGGWRAYAEEARRPDAIDKAADTPDKSIMHGDHGRMP